MSFFVKHICCKNEKERQSTNRDGTQEVLEARRKAGSSLAALQALITPQLQNGAQLSAVRERCLSSGQPAADGSLQVPAQPM